MLGAVAWHLPSPQCFILPCFGRRPCSPTFLRALNPKHNLCQEERGRQRERERPLPTRAIPSLCLTAPICPLLILDIYCHDYNYYCHYVFSGQVVGLSYRHGDVRSWGLLLSASASICLRFNYGLCLLGFSVYGPTRAYIRVWGRA